jgi:deoxyhypusine synthase
LYIMSVSVPAQASAAVLQPSEPVSDSAISVQGPNFEEKPSLQELLKSYERIGFQANSLGRAIDIVNRMVRFS